MSDQRRFKKEGVIEAGVEEMDLENGGSIIQPGWSKSNGFKEESGESHGSTPRDLKMESETQSPNRRASSTHSPDDPSAKHEEMVGGYVTLKMEPGQPPKLARSSSHKMIAGPAQLYSDEPDKTEEARNTFQVLSSCLYSSKYIGSSKTEEVLECECPEQWDSVNRVNTACGDDDVCINRATKMECYGDCGCGAECLNQRFQLQQFAEVTVFKTEKKGYGLRANTDLIPNEFIYEYIGEVINEAQFRKRMVQYDEEGVKHFYFMSLSKGEFVDATKKGNLGRFCNHSCNPNCYVDKWVVGDKLRMGIFAERKIKAGEELVFNYNVDRYGADPQPCYCGEPNCTGFIGGKTQTERATKLSTTTIEALGIDDGDSWDTAVAKKPRKKKVGEDDEEYVSSVQPRSLDEGGVTKVMATLMQCKEKWIAVKLLGRIQRCDDTNVRNRVVKMHGYQILNSTLSMWKEDANIILQVFDILKSFPLLTRNKISDSKIEATVESLKEIDNELVRSEADYLLTEWSKLEVGYRIPRMKREAGAGTPNKPVSNRFGRRDSREERKARSETSKSPNARSRSRSIDAPRGPSAPNGPRSGFPQRAPGHFGGPRPQFRSRLFNALPAGWSVAQAENGQTYYYNTKGKTTWEKPTQPVAPPAPPAPPPKPVSREQILNDLIKGITNAKAHTSIQKPAATATPEALANDTNNGDMGRKEKWRSYPEEKQRRIYENTLFPHIKSIMDKYKGKLPKDDLKRFAKEIGKKLVNSDYKNGRVKDPTSISEKQEKQVRRYVKDFFDKAVEKDKERQKRKAERKAKEGNGYTTPPDAGNTGTKGEDPETKSDQDRDVAISDDEEEEPKLGSTTPATPLDQLSLEGFKRKRDLLLEDNGVKLEDEDSTPHKRLKSESPPPPPPPPPAPTNGIYPEMENDLDGEIAGGMGNSPIGFAGGVEDLEDPPGYQPPGPGVHDCEIAGGVGEASLDEKQPHDGELHG